MGRISLPSIAKLEDVLDLLTDPDKYIKYLQEFRDAYDEAVKILGVVDTKEKADQALSKALDEVTEAKRYEANAHTKIAALQTEVNDAFAQLEKEKERVTQFASTLAAKVHTLAVQENELQQKSKTFELQNTATQHMLDAREKQLIEKASILDNERKELDAKLEKFAALR